MSSVYDSDFELSDSIVAADPPAPPARSSARSFVAGLVPVVVPVPAHTHAQGQGWEPGEFGDEDDEFTPAPPTPAPAQARRKSEPLMILPTPSAPAAAAQAQGEGRERPGEEEYRPGVPGCGRGPFERYGVQLAAAGWPVLPFLPSAGAKPAPWLPAWPVSAAGERKEEGRLPGQFHRAGSWLKGKRQSGKALKIVDDCWSRLADWQRFARLDPAGDEFQSVVAEWATWPAASVGIMTGGYARIVAVDLDTDDPRDAAKVLSIVAETIGVSDFERCGRPNRRTLFYRSAEPEFNARGSGKIEVFGTVGRQTAAYGLHPNAGKNYHWPNRTLIEATPANLPIISADAVREMIARIAHELPHLVSASDRAAAAERADAAMRAILAADDAAAGRAGTASAQPPTATPTANKSATSSPLPLPLPAGDRGRTGTPEALALALAHIGAVDEYSSWVRLVMAARAGGAAEEDVKAWSRLSGKFDEAGFRRAWNGARSTADLGAGTVYFEAQASGWKCPQGVKMFPGGVENYADIARPVTVAKPLPGAEKSAVVEPAAELGNGKTDGSAVAEKVESIADRLARYDEVGEDEQRILDLIGSAGGVLADITAWITQTAVSPQPVLALAAAISAVSAASARRYVGPTGLRTNLQVVAVASSSSGKDHPIKSLRRSLFAAEMGNRVSGPIGSRAGLHDMMSECPTRIMIEDEIGDYIKEVYNPKGVSTISQIAKQLRMLFSGDETPLIPDALSKRDEKKKERKPIKAPFLGVFGACTPGSFIGAFTPESLVDGSASRWLYFESPRNIPLPQKPDSNRHVPMNIKDALQEIAKGGDIEGSLNQSPDEPPPEFNIGWSGIGDDASALFDEMRLDEVQRKRRIDIEGGRASGFKLAVAGRRCELALRLAAIRAISRDPTFATIDSSDLRWGAGVVDWCSAAFVKRVGETASAIGATPAEIAVAAIEAVVEAAGEAGATQSTLYRKTERLAEKERDSALRTLLGGGKIVAVERRGKGRPATVYKLARYAPPADGEPAE